MVCADPDEAPTYAVRECHCKTPERSESLTSGHEKTGDVVSVNSPRLNQHALAVGHW